MEAHLLNVFLQATHLLFITQHLYHIIAGYDSQFRIQRLNHLYVAIAHPIEDHWVYILQNYMLFYQFLKLINYFSAKLQKGFHIPYFFLIFVPQKAKKTT